MNESIIIDVLKTEQIILNKVILNC